MKSRITITPTTNIKDNQVVDYDKVEKRTYDSDMDVFEFLDVVRNEKRRANLMNVSLYNDVIVEGDIHYKILHMLTNPIEETKREKFIDCSESILNKR